MRLKNIYAAIAFLLLALPPGLHAALPNTLNYQGRLRFSGGALVPDSVSNSVTFRIFSVATGGVSLWAETWSPATTSGVTTTSGLFNVVIGSFVPVSLPFDQPYWLEIVCDNAGTPEAMAPRQPLTTSPYAFRAKQLDAPASMTSTTGATALFAANTGSGHGIYGLATGGSGYGVQGASNTNIGVFGQGGPYGVYGDGLSAGVYGNSGSVGGIGVQGNGTLGYGGSFSGVTGIAASGSVVGVSASSATGVGIYAQSNFAGIIATSGSGSGGRFFGTSAGGIGAFARGDAAGATGLWAENPFGGNAMVVSGSAQLGYNGGGATFTYLPGNTVNFTGVSVLGLGGVSAPLSLTLSSATSSPLSVSNATGTAILGQGGPIGISGSAYNSINGIGGYFQGVTGVVASGTNTGVAGTTSGNSNQSAGVVGVAFAASPIGVVGLNLASGPGAGVGVYGEGNDDSGIGVKGKANSSVGGGVGVLATTGLMGNYGLVAQQNASGAGSAVAISATSSGSTGQAIYGRANSTAPLAEFVNDGAGSPLKINALNFPTGTGGAGQVLSTNGTNQMSWIPAPAPAAPVSLTLSSFTSSPLSVSNATGAAILAQGVTGVAALGASIGISATASSGTGMAVYARSSGSVGTIRAQNDGAGSTAYAIDAQSAGGTAIKVNSSGGTGVDVNTSAAQPGVNSFSTGGYGVQGQTNVVALAGIYGINTAGAGSGAGVIGESTVATGVLGRSNGSGIGVVATSVSGIGLSSTASGVSSIAGYFQGVTGIVSVGHSVGVSAVADAAGGTGMAAYAADGNAIYARNWGGGGFKPTIYSEASGTNHAIGGKNVASGAFGTLGGTPNNGTVGVYGRDISSTFTKGVWGESTGYGVYGTGLTGVAGVVTATGQTALFGDAAGQVGALALHTMGDALIQGGSVTFTPGTNVYFTGTNVFGLAPSVPNPLSLTLSTAANSPLSVSNATGTAVLARGVTGVAGLFLTSGPGIGVLGSTESPLTVSPSFPVGVLGLSNRVGGYGMWAYGAGSTAAALGAENDGAGYAIDSYQGGPAGAPVGIRSTVAFAPLGIAVLGQHGTSAIPGLGYPVGIYGRVTQTGGVAIIADGVGLGLSATASNNISGVGGYFNGVTGVVASGSAVGISASSATGVGIYTQSNFAGIIATSGSGSGGRFFGTSAGGLGVFARGDAAGATGLWAENPFGGNAMVVSGNAQLGYNGGGATITYLPGNTVNFTGVSVLGLPGVTAPLNLTAGLVGSVIGGNNTGTGFSTAMGVSGTATNVGAGTFAMGVYGEGNGTLGSVGYGVYGTSLNGTGTYGSSTNGRGVYGNSANLFGVHGVSTNQAGVFGQGVTGVAASGADIGVSATATSASGIGVYSRVNSSSYAVQGVNDNVNGTAVYGQAVAGGTAISGSVGNGPTNGVAVRGDTLDFGIGVYGSSASGIGVQAKGSTFGISATASAGNGQAIYGRVNSTKPAAEFFNDAAGGIALKVNNMKFPPNDTGQAGKMLSTDGSGNLSWASAGVSAPLSLTLNSATASPLSVSNATGTAISITTEGPTAIGIKINTGGMAIDAVSAGDGGVISAMMTNSSGGIGAILGIDAGPVNPGSDVGGVYGQSTGNYGVIGHGGTGAGLYGDGVTGTVTTGSAIGISATATNTINGVGGYFQALTGTVAIGSNTGVVGQSTGNNNQSAGVIGLSFNNLPIGVAGLNLASGPGAGVGVYGEGNNDSGVGVKGKTNSSVGGGIGVLATTSLTGNYALVATQGAAGAGMALAISATSAGSGGQAIYGRVNSSLPAAEFINDQAGGIGLKINNMKFPSNDTGQAGKLLSTDGTGNLTWASATGVTTPLNLTDTAAGSAIFADSTGAGVFSGTGLYGRAAGAYPAIVADGSSMGLSASASASSGVGLAAYATDGNAIYARNFGPGGFKASIMAEANNTNHAVEGKNITTGALGTLGGETNNGNIGVYGQSSTGVGVFGKSTNSGFTGGVWGENTTCCSAFGVVGSSMAGPSFPASNGGVIGFTQTNSGFGVYGSNEGSSGNAYGVYGKSASPSGVGVQGQSKYGVVGTTIGSPTLPTNAAGVVGFASSSSGYGVYAANGSGMALLAEGSSVGISSTANTGNGLGGYFQGLSGVAVSATNIGISITAGGPTINNPRGLVVNMDGAGTAVGVSISVGSASSTNYGLYSRVNSDNAAVFGKNDSPGGFGAGVRGVGLNGSIALDAINPAASAGSAGGAALLISGTVKVGFQGITDTAGAAATVPTFTGCLCPTYNATNGHIWFSGGKTATSYTVNNSFATNTSMVLVSFKSATITVFGVAVTVAPGGGSFTVHFNPAPNLVAGDAMSFMIINQQ
jgi:hypothetical protein